MKLLYNCCNISTVDWPDTYVRAGGSGPATPVLAGPVSVPVFLKKIEIL